MRTFPLAFLSFFVSSAISAPSNRLEEIMVTATRTTQTVNEALAPVSVITRDEIERKQPRSVQDLLRGTPGLSITNSGGQGKQTSVFVRGTNSDHVLVLVDGIKMGSATAGTFSFQDIPVDMIERIEVVRGPRSALYGSEAIGGVIQIFTRRASNQSTLNTSFTTGSRGTYEGFVGSAVSSQDFWMSANLQSQSTDGIDSREGDEVDKDGFDNQSAHIRAGFRSPALTGEVFWLKNFAESEYDGSWTNETEPNQQSAGLDLEYVVTDSYWVNLVAGQSRDEAENFLNGEFVDRYQTKRQTVSVVNGLSFLGQGELIVGLDWQKDQVDVNLPFAVDHRETKSAFVQLQQSFDGVDTLLAVRNDDIQRFGSHNTGNLALGWDLSSNLRATIGYGQAYKAPTFNELYFPGYGRKDLQAEESETSEIGLHANYAWGKWNTQVFTTNINQLIETDYSLGQWGMANNTDKAKIDGVESVVSTELFNWYISGAVTFLEPVNDSNNKNKGKVLMRRVKRSLKIDMDRDIGRYQLGATFLAQGKRYNDVENTEQLPGLGLLDLRMGYRFSSRLQVQGVVENVLDKTYQTVSTYNQPGRSVYVTVRYQPEL